ncbi:MAG: single-stranded-DNA-specific exonuclease RecJ [Puniceicoccales bacterium]|jgi:single-stranded-DNA-specific exonuclease|nr:single-stranded-DNA-specific exonuclease RecJ [Puniceicoccales bacterium]
MRWYYEDDIPIRQIEALCKHLGISKFLAKLLGSLGYLDVPSAFNFLNPSLKNLENPSDIAHLDQVVQMINEACKADQSIGVISDYDVDGITSMALLHRYFETLNYSFTPFFPDREKEGYGLSEQVVERVMSAGKFDLIVALDCGTNAVAPIDLLNKNEIDVIVIDHHQPNCEKLPRATIINPHVDPRNHSTSAQQLCTVGLVFKLIHAWVKVLKTNHFAPALSIRLKPFLDLVALGTIADLVPLLEENRLLVHFGLKELRQSRLLGIKSLLKFSGIEAGAPLSTDDVAYRLAPRINVSGRLSSADLPFRLLTSRDMNMCDTWADTLNWLNLERQQIEKQIVMQAEQMIRAYPKNALVYVLYNPNWHVGVVGVAAGKLAHQYGKPVFVLGKQGDFAKGSGRSVHAVNLVNLLQQGNGDIERWGGHPAAVGLTAKPEKLVALEQSLENTLRATFKEGIPEPQLHVATALNFEDFSEKLLNELERMAPFGQGNEAPVFVLKRIILPKKSERFGNAGAHLRLFLNNISIIGWGMGTVQLPVNYPINLAVKVTWNYWQRKKRIQMYLVDWQKCD